MIIKDWDEIPQFDVTMMTGYRDGGYLWIPPLN